MALADGLVGYWSAWLGSSGYRLLDRSKRSNHGTPSGMDAGTDWLGSTINGKSGFVLDFDGTNDFIRVTQTQEIYNLRAANKSIYAWVKTSSPGSSYRTVFSADRNFALTIKDSVFITYDWAAGSDRSSGVNVADGKWHLLQANILSGVTSGSQLLIDGISKATFTYSNQTGTATFDMSIGTGLGGGNLPANEYVAMQVAEVGLFSRYLGSSECLELYRLGPGWYRPYSKRSIGYAAAQFNRRRRILCGDYN